MYSVYLPPHLIFSIVVYLTAPTTNSESKITIYTFPPPTLDIAARNSTTNPCGLMDKAAFHL